MTLLQFSLLKIQKSENSLLYSTLLTKCYKFLWSKLVFLLYVVLILPLFLPFLWRERERELGGVSDKKSPLNQEVIE